MKFMCGTHLPVNPKDPDISCEIFLGILLTFYTITSGKLF